MNGQIWPMTLDYVSAVQSAPSTFQIPQLRSARFIADGAGPRTIEGQRAVVFFADTDEGPLAVRCLKTPLPAGAERYTALRHYLAQHPVPALIRADWIEDGIQVKGNPWPVVTMERVAGPSLLTFVERNLDNPARLRRVAAEWRALISELSAASIAHGDLQQDNIMLAGVPMMNGSSTMEGYMPDFDATIVMLDAGAEIKGKVHCEHFCLSGGSHTNSSGPVHNPHKMGYSAGGSSSGSGVVVALGEVDMAIGGDQGGSIRMPSSFCGTYGMKPTWGLVPYTGIMPIEIFVDHTGPMTANVADNALLLEVLAGDDGYDPRIKAPKVQEYTKALGLGVKGMKIGVVKEGFQQATAEAAVNESVRRPPIGLPALAPASRKSRSRCTWSGPRSGFRSAPKA